MPGRLVEEKDLGFGQPMRACDSAAAVTGELVGARVELVLDLDAPACLKLPARYSRARLVPDSPWLEL
jgi:hypothetical protein